MNDRLYPHRRRVNNQKIPFDDKDSSYRNCAQSKHKRDSDDWLNLVCYAGTNLDVDDKYMFSYIFSIGRFFELNHRKLLNFAPYIFGTTTILSAVFLVYAIWDKGWEYTFLTFFAHTILGGILLCLTLHVLLMMVFFCHFFAQYRIFQIIRFKRHDELAIQRVLVNGDNRYEITGEIVIGTYKHTPFTIDYDLSNSRLDISVPLEQANIEYRDLLQLNKALRNKQIHVTAFYIRKSIKKREVKKQSEIDLPPIIDELLLYTGLGNKN